MFLLSCGRESVEAPAVSDPDTQLRPSYETFIQKKHARAKELRTTKLKNEDMWSHSASEYDDGTPFSGSTRLDRAMKGYDGIAAQVRPLSNDLKAAFKDFEPGLWVLARPGNPKDLVRSNVAADRDEMAIPEHHVGFYQTFCQPQLWSPAFASPGDFTIKMASVSQKDGEACFQIAVICSCIKAIRDGARVKEVSKRKSFVKHIKRTQSELARFTETMTLRYIGHRLADKMPKHASLLSKHDQSSLDEFGEDVILFLSYVLSISEIGFNLLVTLTDPVVKNILVREFLDLSLGYGDPALMAVSSCDARLERQEARPLLPSAWLDVDTSVTTNELGAHSKSCYFHFSPRGGDDITSRSFSRFSENNFDAPNALYRSQSDGLRPTTMTKSCPPSKCIRFIPPIRFHTDKHTDGAFTVEISGVSITEGHANYSISVLCYVYGSLEITTVDRRYSEFDALAQKIESKVDTLRIRKLLPSKTMFRYLSASYLERRAASLQVFLEKLLKMQFLGILDQEIPIIAEPNVRAFLQLPIVEWSLVPNNKDSRVRGISEWHMNGPPKYSPPSPMVGEDSLPMYTPPLIPDGYPLYDRESLPRYQSLVKRRGDSM
uniref:PX domain-containing protein n=1 Tax=Globisporangium ultimum (strain ATCC 200006 / CBS 805.95 / DAOM BR144) TaxID=431595 RepID=K3XBT4_GLOUD